MPIKSLIESDIVKIWTLNFVFLHYTNILAYNVKLECKAIKLSLKIKV